MKLSGQKPVQSLVLDQDQSLMLKVSQGDRVAFAQLFEKFKGPIMSYLKTWMQDTHTAEELCQETFLKVYRAREAWSPQAKFSTWVWTIARNTALDYLEKKKVVLAYEGEDGNKQNIWDALESPLPHAEALLIESMNEKLIQNSIASLTLSEREVLGLKIFTELSYDEIATQLNIPVGTVKTVVFRSKKKLIEYFRKAKG